MDNQGIKDDTKQSNSTQSNSTHHKGKVLARMESVVSSVTSTQELVETTSATNFHSNAKAGKIKVMISNCSRRMLLAIICLLAIGILTMTTLYVLEYRKKEQPSTVKELVSKECREFIPDTILNEMPTELKTLLPAIESKITSTAQLHGLKAVSYGIAYNGKLWWTFHYGRKNFTNPSSPPPDSDTPYPAASFTKIYTAVMLMKLIENGVIKSLDDPISKYDPVFKVKNPFNKERLSFRQLVCMTTGLPREAPCNPPSEYNFCPYNTTEMWRRISNIELYIRPNMATTYSNLGYAVLGRVMERILNGTKYEEWIKREIFDKLGLRNTGFNIRQRYNSIPVSTDSKNRIAKIMDWGWLRPAGGIYTSLNDLHKFFTELIERLNTTLLMTSSKRRIFSHEYENPMGCPMAMWRLTRDTKIVDESNKVDYKQTFYTFNGITIGYFSQVRLSPQNTLATYGLSADGGNYMNFGQLDSNVGELVFKTVSNALKKKQEKYVAPSNMEAYVGVYKVSSYWPLIQKNLIISIKDGRLHLTLEWFAADLTYVSPWKLKAVYSFNRRHCKDQVLQSGLLNDIYVFDKPVNGTNKSQGFYVRSISSYGYTSFVRV